MTTTTLTEPGAELTTRGRTITEADLVSFSSLTGDWHPQHCDSEWAAASRFGERVAHGMLVLSYAVGLMPFDPERVVALRGLDGVTFKRPVRVGDTIRVRSRVSDARPLDEGHELVSLDWRVVNQRDEVVARARVDALWKVDAPQSGNGRMAGGAGKEAEEAEAEGNLVLL
jgi:3-hydroxybutyryl-CoA dehydratase